MQGGFADDTKEQIRQAVNIVDLAGGYLQLRRQGRNYVAKCPWHDDSRPSLQINEERQTFKCWVCDIGGDVFSFLMRMERLEFREALAMLAERTGIALKSSGLPAAEPGSPGDKRTQLAAMEWAAKLFSQQLYQSQQAKGVIDYLATRDISDEMRVKFQIGFSPPDWEWLVRKANGSPFSPAVLERVGLIGKRETGGFYDRFRGRLMFPIRDVRGRAIAFGGRVLPEFADERSAKYVNSPETPLYSKSDQLYALDQARDTIASSGKAVVMEGYTDVIMAHQYGVTNAIACCGTALGEGHLRLLGRFTDQIVLVLDGDEAGQKRTAEVLELFIANQVDLRILTLPQGLDPCDYLLQHGRDEWESLLATASDALEYKMQQVETQVGPNPSTHAASQGVEELLRVLAKFHVQAGEANSAALLREQQVLGRVARKFHVGEDKLRERLTTLRRSSKRITQPRPSQNVASSDPNSELQQFELEQTELASPAVLSLWEQEIFELVLSNPALVGPIVQTLPLEAMASHPAQWLFGQVQELHFNQQSVTFDGLMAATQNERQKKLLIDLEESAQSKQTSDHDERLRDLLAHFQSHHQRQDRRKDLTDLREGELNPQEEEQLLSRYFDNLKRQQTGSLSTDG